VVTETTLSLAGANYWVSSTRAFTAWLRTPFALPHRLAVSTALQLQASTTLLHTTSVAAARTVNCTASPPPPPPLSMPRRQYVADLAAAVADIPVTGISNVQPGGDDGEFTFTCVADGHSIKISALIPGKSC
jgi:hypothetical protein